VKALRIAVVAGAMLAPCAVSAGFQEGAAAYRNRDFAKALAEFKSASEAGDARAMAMVGSMYRNGNGVTQDYEEALRWLKRAAARNYDEAQAELGIMHVLGQGVPIDFAEAVRWFELAVRQGNHRAMSALASMHRDGRGMDVDHAKSLDLFRRAAERGSPVAYMGMGNAYERGLGVDRNPNTALDWYRKALAAGDKNADAAIRRVELAIANARPGEIRSAARETGALSTDGKQDLEAGTAAYRARDYATALKLLAPLAEQGNTIAQNHLGIMHRGGLGVPASAAEAAKWYRRAAEAGYAVAQVNLAGMLERGEGGPVDLSQARSWYQKAEAQGEPRAKLALSILNGRFVPVRPSAPRSPAELRSAAAAGDSNAQNDLGLAHERGAGVERSDAEAVRWFRAAADRGHAQGQVNLGRKYLSGLGVERSAAQAASWFRKAADAGHAEAQFFLGALLLGGDGVAKDAAGGQQWLEKAAEQRHAAATLRLALAHARGEAAAPNLGESDRWIARVESELDRMDRGALIDLLEARRRPIVTAAGRIYFLGAGRQMFTESARDPASARLASDFPVDAGAAPFSAAALDELISQQRYVDAVLRLRAAREEPAALRWLTRQAEAGHAILQFELASWLSQNEASLAVRWYFQGLLSSAEDAALCADPSGQFTAQRIRVRYLSLARIADREPGRVTDALRDASAANAALERRHSPAWICFSPSLASTAAAPRLKPEISWSEERRKARETLGRLLEKGVEAMVKRTST
jgi:TPR repeat protein